MKIVSIVARLHGHTRLIPKLLIWIFSSDSALAEQKIRPLLYAMKLRSMQVRESTYGILTYTQNILNQSFTSWNSCAILIIVVRSKTSDQKLATFETFLAEHPETPYRSEIERQILKSLLPEVRQHRTRGLSGNTRECKVKIAKRHFISSVKRRWTCANAGARERLDP